MTLRENGIVYAHARSVRGVPVDPGSSSNHKPVPWYNDAQTIVHTQ